VSAAVADWFGFATHVLERTRRTAGADDVSRVQLWPEHFDPAFEVGSNARGAPPGYGASPGDDAHPEPYLYVAACGDIDRTDPHWNDTAFDGASLGIRRPDGIPRPLQPCHHLLPGRPPPAQPMTGNTVGPPTVGRRVDLADHQHPAWIARSFGRSDYLPLGPDDVAMLTQP
jgi:hypothetical protein